MSFDFGVLQRFVEDGDVTDINFNGTDLWIDCLRRGRYKVAHYGQYQDIQNMVLRLMHATNMRFNDQSPVMECDVESHRISVLHEAITKSYAVSIRSLSAKCRYTMDSIVGSGCISHDALLFLKMAVEARCNILVSGQPSAGKTEFLRFLLSFIADYERVITIEDVAEIFYKKMHPSRDGVALQINESCTYRKAIRSSLRQRVDWLVLNEIRGSEVMDLLNALSSGAAIMSTLHAKSAQEIPERLLFMMPHVDLGSKLQRSIVQEAVHVGIHMGLQIEAQRVSRFVVSVCYFDSQGAHLIYDRNNTSLQVEIPQWLKERHQRIRGFTDD